MDSEGHDIPGRWNGEVFEPQYEPAKTWCQHNLHPWEHVTLTIWRARTKRTHNHQFAWLHDALENLPEKYLDEPWAQTEDHLRKYALIRTGYFNCQTIPVDSREEAMRWATILREMDSYCIVVARDDVVYRYTAQSQKMKEMGRDRFQKSKQAILEFIAGLIGVHHEDLARMGSNRRKKPHASK